MFKIILFSDIHVWDLWSRESLMNLKGLLGRANLFLKRRRQFPPCLSEAVISEIVSLSADAVIFTGDLTTASLSSEFNKCRKLLAPIMEKWGDRFFIIPGNHDRYTASSVKKGFFEKFISENSVYPELIECENYVFILLDLSIPRWITSRGKIDDSDLQRVDSLLSGISSKGKKIICVGHYPLIYPPERVKSWFHQLDGRFALLDLLSKHGVFLYLNGHHHIRYAIHAGKTMKSEWKCTPWMPGGIIEPDSVLCVNPGSAGLNSLKMNRAAGFLEISVDASNVIDITSTCFQINGENVSRIRGNINERSSL
jgi:3',5'-cyclic AMP phosphodiesterase CpdA